MEVPSLLNAPTTALPWVNGYVRFELPWMPWIIRLNWNDSFSARPLVMMVDDILFTSWQVTHASTMLRAPPWKALARVFEPEVVPSAPWQALHFSVATTVRRGTSGPVSARSLNACWTIVLTSSRGTASGL